MDGSKAATRKLFVVRFMFCMVILFVLAFHSLSIVVRVYLFFRIARRHSAIGHFGYVSRVETTTSKANQCSHSVRHPMSRKLARFLTKGSTSYSCVWPRFTMCRPCAFVKLYQWPLYLE
jgi:hypothetical protein